MTFSWSLRRKIIYTGAVSIVVTVFLFIAYSMFFTTPPSCANGVQDGSELGVDCGGTCALVCSASARAPVVLWSRAFPVKEGVYSAVAYVQNFNQGAGAKKVHYSFQLFDDQNSLVVERVGVITIPPVLTVPITENAIDVGTRKVSRTLFAFSEEPVWQRVPAGAIPELSLTDQTLSADGTRLSVVVRNASYKEARGLSVTAVLFNAQGVAVGSSNSVISRLSGKASQDVVFTWPQGVEGVARAEITLLPSF